MTGAERTGSTRGALAAASRVAILDVLERSAAALTVVDVADAVGRHPNTVREHLQALVDARLVVRFPEVRTVRGRPRTLYRRPAPAEGRDPGAGLDRAVRDRLRDAALSAYADAGAARDPAAWRQLAALEQHFAELGMEPEARPDEARVHLWSCPVRALAREHEDLVCRVHLRLAGEVLEAAGGPLEPDRLEPFVGPEHCVLHLRRRPRSTAPRPRAAPGA